MTGYTSAGSRTSTVAGPSLTGRPRPTDQTAEPLRCPDCGQVKFHATTLDAAGLGWLCDCVTFVPADLVGFDD